MNTIVVGFDGSEQSRRALDRAASMAPAKELVVVTAVPFRPLATKGPSPTVDPLEEEERSKLLEEAVGITGAQSFTTRAVEVHGDPAEAIVAAAKESGADLIVIGKHGRHGAFSALMGSTSEHVVRHAPCDVLVVQ